MINKKALNSSIKNFHGNHPFDHCVIDNFLKEDVLEHIIEEFPHYDAEEWLAYNNPLEDKKTSNVWHLMPKYTYSLFQYLNSHDFTEYLSDLVGEKLYADYGLHGGGLHCHSDGAISIPIWIIPFIQKLIYKDF